MVDGKAALPGSAWHGDLTLPQGKDVGVCSAGWEAACRITWERKSGSDSATLSWGGSPFSDLAPVYFYVFLQCMVREWAFAAQNMVIK